MRKFICVIAMLSSCLCFVINPAFADGTIVPKRLQRGDVVGLVASASPVADQQLISDAVSRLEALGLSVKVGDTTKHRYGYLAGSDQARATELNQMFADKSIKAIFHLRGGWGSARMLPYLDYENISKNPKIIIGFSDITALLLAIHAKTGLITYHGTMGVEAWPAFTVGYMKQVLFDGVKVSFENDREQECDKDIIQTEYKIQIINPGKAQGRLIGGNLTILASMLGTPYLPDWKGAILFVEDVGEEYYKIDRMLAQLKLAGVLDQLAGFVFGKCTDCHASRSETGRVIGSANLQEILAHYIKPLNIPAYSGAMIGHESKMFTLPIGALAEINAQQGKINLLDSAVSG